MASLRGPGVLRLDDILTKLRIPNTIPATVDLVRDLQTLGRLVRQACRNKLKLYRIISRVRDLIDYIHEDDAAEGDDETLLEKFDQHGEMALLMGRCAE